MKERVCRFQRTVFDIGAKVHISSCGNYKCIHHCSPVSHMICDDCPLREPPDEEDEQWRQTLGDVYDISEIETRTPEERQEILETYCLKCKFLDQESKTCNACGCTSHAPVDEYAKFVDFHCPLELW
jgi:hypothetical protein